LPLILDSSGNPRTIPFYTAARKVWDGATAITCDPDMTEGKAVAAVDSQMALSWSEVLLNCNGALAELGGYPPALPGNSPPYGFFDSQSLFQSRFSLVDKGFKLISSNALKTKLDSDSFYNERNCVSVPGLPKVVCVPGDTEHKQCDGVDTSTGWFPIPIPTGQGGQGICPKYKFNLVNGWKDHIWEYSYLVDFDACWPDACDCTIDGNTSGYSGVVNDSATDEVRGKVKTSIIVNGITPEPSTGCPQ
jgi:hypothetical protein